MVNDGRGLDVYRRHGGEPSAMIRAVDGELIDECSGEIAEPVPSTLEGCSARKGMGVYRTLYAFTGGRADVDEDATAEAFARALAQRDDLRDPLAWIYRAAFRVAIDELRADLLRSAGGVIADVRTTVTLTVSNGP